MVSISNQELAALGESVALVLEGECGNRKLHEFVDGKIQLDKVLWRKASELGWLSLGLPEEYGGLGLGISGLGLLHHELGRRLAPGPYISTLSAAQCLLMHGSEALKKNYLPRISVGELTVAVPATPSAQGTGLVLREGKLQGHFENILGAASVDVIIAPYRAEDGNAAWAVIATDGETTRLTPEVAWDATRELCTLECVDATVSGVINNPEQVSVTLGLHLALAIACDCIGGMDTILNQTIEYLKGRTQFDRSLASFQALKHRAANLKVVLETSRHLVAQAVDSAAGNQPEASLWSSLAKASVTDAYARMAEDCLQLHGGVGFTWEFDCHLFLKRARFNQALVGSSSANLDDAAEALVIAALSDRSVTELAL